MAKFVLDDLNQDFWSQATVRAQLEGWPMKDLIIELLTKYVKGEVRLPNGRLPLPTRPTPGTIEITLTCPRCNKTMAVTFEAWPAGQFGPMVMQSVQCPHCQQPTSRALPGRLTQVSTHRRIPPPSQDEIVNRFTLHEYMWARQGPTVTYDNPIAYEVRGLPRGQDARIALMGRQKWQFLYAPAPDAKVEWQGDYADRDTAFEAFKETWLHKGAVVASG